MKLKACSISFLIWLRTQCCLSWACICSTLKFYFSLIQITLQDDNSKNLSYLCTSFKPFKISLWHTWSVCICVCVWLYTIIHIYYYVIYYITYFRLYFCMLLLFDSILSKPPFVKFAVSKHKFSTPCSIWFLLFVCSCSGTEYMWPIHSIQCYCVIGPDLLTLSIISKNCEVPICDQSPRNQG